MSDTFIIQLSLYLQIILLDFKWHFQAIWRRNKNHDKNQRPKLSAKMKHVCFLLHKLFCIQSMMRVALPFSFYIDFNQRSLEMWNSTGTPCKQNHTDIVPHPGHQ